MRAVKMMVDHEPKAGLWGDCFRCCIASLLDLPAEQVPHFMHGDNEDGTEDCRLWLQGRGLDYLELPLKMEMEAVLDMMDRWFSGRHYMLSGQSPRGTNHSVVCHNGQIVHDPTHRESGLDGPCDDGFYWIGIITAAL